MTRTGVTLDGDGVECRDDIFNLRAEELGRRTQGISVLAKFALVFANKYILLLTACELAALQEVPNGTRGLDLNKFLVKEAHI